MVKKKYFIIKGSLMALAFEISSQESILRGFDPSLTYNIEFNFTRKVKGNHDENITIEYSINDGDINEISLTLGCDPCTYKTYILSDVNMSELRTNILYDGDINLLIIATPVTIGRVILQNNRPVSYSIL